MKKISVDLKLSSESFTRKKKSQCQKKLIEQIKSDPNFNELRTL